MVNREPVTGFEPVTCCLRNSCSTPELHWHLLSLGKREGGRYRRNREGGKRLFVKALNWLCWSPAIRDLLFTKQQRRLRHGNSCCAVCPFSASILPPP